jgi:D-alanyl-D-alanine carboxypeptidase
MLAMNIQHPLRAIIRAVQLARQRRWAIAALLALCLWVAGVAPAANATDSKYAGYVIELNSGRVLYSKNADEPRHPASLTKAMTIYLAFEAVQQGHLRWDSKLKVSAKAASQPQTNIGLRAGDTISVKDAIEALIVRSANDVAVVVAEAIGDTEWNFALMMTQKARALGMKNTVFKNANGLHHPQQVTTAKDMARIAIALERDFPDYFPVFKTTEFRHKGKTYETHNRVMRYYRGATGLKTGFVRASGFNLITTARRNGNDVVAVVLGGQSSKSRDNQMIGLLDKAFAQLDGRAPAKDMAFADDMEPELKGGPKLPSVSGAPNRFMKLFEGRVPMPVAGKGAPLDAAPIATAAVASPAQPTAPTPTSPSPLAATVNNLAASPAAGQPAQPAGTAPIHTAPTNTAMVPTARWGIQVGTFSNPNDAAAAVAHASSLAKSALQGAAVAITGVGDGPAKLHRARLAGLSQEQAQSACQLLLAAQEACFVYQQN